MMLEEHALLLGPHPLLGQALIRAILDVVISLYYGTFCNSSLGSPPLEHSS